LLAQIVHPDDQIILFSLGIPHPPFQKPNMKIFGDEQTYKKQIAVSQPILEKPEKGTISQTDQSFCQYSVP
jgi:DNA-directed RNA polymerase subunit L